MEDTTQEFIIELACPNGLTMDQIDVDFQKCHNRIPHPDKDLEDSISSNWEKTIVKNPHIYNGSKFRYNGFKILETRKKNENVDEPFRICLYLGLTDYKSHMGTSMHEKWKNFFVPEKNIFEKMKHFANPLGNCALVETKNEKIVVLQRANNVGEFPNVRVFPGGHPEPEEVGITTDVLNGDIPLDLKKKILSEFFEGTLREVVEEVGIPLNALSDIRFLGSVWRMQNMRPVSVFKVKTSLNDDEIIPLYAKATHSFESLHISFASKEELDSVSACMPGCHKGAAKLYLQSLQS